MELLHNGFVRIVAIGGDSGPLNEVASGFFKGSREDIIALHSIG
jgi:hypothetical protein